MAKGCKPSFYPQGPSNAERSSVLCTSRVPFCIVWQDRQDRQWTLCTQINPPLVRQQFKLLCSRSQSIAPLLPTDRHCPCLSSSSIKSSYSSEISYHDRPDLEEYHLKRFARTFCPKCDKADDGAVKLEKTLRALPSLSLYYGTKE